MKSGILAVPRALPCADQQDGAPLPPGGAAFHVDGVDFAYDGAHPTFRSLALTARPGEFVALLGPSGCGKTTLLNLLSGFLPPDSGRITIDGETVTPEMPALGYAFQSPQLFPWLNVLDNVRFGLRMAGRLPDTEQRDKAMAALALVGLEAAAGKFPHQLSGGMQQRVALARALVLEPRLLLMDEPFAALDAITRATLNEELLRLCGRLGQTVLFITHDVEEAVFLADRVVLLGIAPAGIHSELAIDLPRPRRLRETRRLERFTTLTDTLLERISAIVATA
ncbi:ABC transporter ATP-binding protein [Azospirillum picis]|uniref:NitT/TauT family transport system ATP-binding protein n=1 Tax=Azospirillum picis TaxID=488438 RepID=A0ABU0MV82_9PROT|nr:ABC transporter ATP-binding protein [Azospirillum picis]MBP2303519.1 NitT/TauT family transport system ATP-binding protein [Azospirillum picis]MDQ0537403.1 NitT/TauT family transport system ATP-binding protein [Azospirillum picis]